MWMIQSKIGWLARRAAGTGWLGTLAGGGAAARPTNNTTARTYRQTADTVASNRD